MDRRDFLKLGAIGVSLAAAGLAGCLKPAGRTRPNVLFIAIDDLNTWIGCLGHLREGLPVARTPNLDRLAGQGMLFSNAHTPIPWCMPARNALFVGQYANQTGMYVDEPLRERMPSVRTLPQHFMDHGYTALASGKLFHDTQREEDSWNQLEIFARPPSQKARSPKLSGVTGQRPSDNLDWGQIAVPETEYADAMIADRTIQHLQARHEQPFFIAAGFRFPHLPWYLPKALLDLYPVESISLPWVREDDLDDVPEAARRIAISSPFENTLDPTLSDHALITRADGWKKAVQAYLASITFADMQLGRVLDALDASAHAANTHVVLWSDNGFHLGEKLHWRKFTLWDQATRVPMMIRSADRRGAGRVVDQPTNLVDIYPTLLEMCGLPPPAHALAGESLAPFIASEAHEKVTPSYITYGKGNDSVVDARWRFIRYGDGTEELYDHSVDPNEWTNLAGNPRWRQERERMAALLERSPR